MNLKVLLQLLSLIFSDSFFSAMLVAQSTPSGPVPIASDALSGTTSSATPSVPSIESMAAQAANNARNNAPKPIGRMELPTSNGQLWVEYDIRPYTQNLKNV